MTFQNRHSHSKIVTFIALALLNTAIADGTLMDRQDTHAVILGGRFHSISNYLYNRYYRVVLPNIASFSTSHFFLLSYGMIIMSSHSRRNHLYMVIPW